MTDFDNSQVEQGQNLIDHLKKIRSMRNERVVDSILAASDFIETLKLPPKSKVLTVGAGYPNTFFWPAKPRNSGDFARPDEPEPHYAWERLLFDKDLDVSVFESDRRANSSWQEVSKKINATSPNKLNVPRDYASSFENSEIQDNSAEVVVAMNLFGTPTLIIDSDKSQEIVHKMAKALKPNGHLITGDTYSSDRDITKELIKDVAVLGCIFKEVARYDKGTPPWVVYKLVSKT